MRFCWFHLMPYPDFPDDFKQKNNSVWVDVNPKLFDPVRAHEIYNEYMDELEFAAECGFDAICVNEHHANGYGLMPSPNLIAASLARRTTRRGDLRAGKLARALQSADAHRRRVRDDRLHLGRAADRRLPGRHADGHLLRLRHEPQHAAPALSRGARPDQGMLAARRRVLVQRPLQPAALRQHLAAPGAEAVPADLDPRRRLGGDLELVRRQRDTSTATCRTTATCRPPRRCRTTGTRWPISARTATRSAPDSCSSSASPRTREEAIRLYREPAEYFYNRSLHVDPRYATPPGYVSEATQRMKMKSQVKIAADRSQLFGSLQDEIAGILKEGYVIIGSPDEVADQLRKIATEFNVGNLLLLLQFGNMDKETTMYNTQHVRRARHAAARRPLRGRVGAQMVAEAARRSGSRRGSIGWRRNERAADQHRRRARPSLPNLAEGIGARPVLVSFEPDIVEVVAVPRGARGARMPLGLLPAGLRRQRRAGAIDDHLTWCLAARDLLLAAGFKPGDTLIGSSATGAIAADVAALWPDLVGRLVLIAPFGLYDMEHAEPGHVRRAGQGGAERVLREPAGLCGSGRGAGGPGSDRCGRSWSTAPRKPPPASCGRSAIPGWRSGCIVSTAPTLLVWGAADKVMPLAYAKALCRRHHGQDLHNRTSPAAAISSSSTGRRKPPRPCWASCTERSFGEPL